MGRTKVPVSALAIERKFLKTDGLHAIGSPPGLYLYVRATARHWVFRYLFAGKRRDFFIAPHAEIDLTEAKTLVMTLRAKVRAGIDPQDERKENKRKALIAWGDQMTFAVAAGRYIDSHEAEWRNDKHAQQWRNTLATYAHPKIGDFPVAQINTAAVMVVLEPIWAEKTETASRLRGRIEAVLDWCRVQGYREGDNPARWKGHLDHLLPAKNKIHKVQSQPALAYKELPAFMTALREMNGMAPRLLEFSILTAARSEQARKATWEEINLDERVWIIPAERMKSDREHRVPLTDAVVALLNALPRWVFTDLLFPGAKRKVPMSNGAMNAVIDRMHASKKAIDGLGWVDTKQDKRIIVQHGFRSTFRDWVGDQTWYPRELAEEALAHVYTTKTESAYARSDLLEKRAHLMLEWSNYCARTGLEESNVVPIRKSN